MKIRVNREETDLAAGSTLLDLIRSRNYPAERVLAAVNGQVCRSDQYGNTRLADGDEVELFCFVCGG